MFFIYKERNSEPVSMEAISNRAVALQTFRKMYAEDSSEIITLIEGTVMLQTTSLVCRKKKD